MFHKYSFESVGIVTETCDKDKFLFRFLNRIWRLWLNLTELKCGKTLYPLCSSLSTFVSYIGILSHWCLLLDNGILRTLVQKAITLKKVSEGVN